MLESIARNIDKIGVGITVATMAGGVAMACVGFLLGGPYTLWTKCTAFFGLLIFGTGGAGAVWLLAEKDMLFKMVKERNTQANIRWAREHRHLQAE